MKKIYRASWSDWNEHEEVAVVSSADAVDLAKKLHRLADPPMMLYLWQEGAERNLGIGLGREHTVMTYQDSNKPPYFISQGEDKAEGAEWFCSGHEETEFLARNLVPSDLIAPTLKAFMAIDTIPPTIKWERL